MAGKRRITNKLDRLFKTEIQSLVTSLGQRNVVEAVIVTKVDCPNCEVDPIHRSSTGVYNGTGPKPFTGNVCPVCQNKGTTETISKRRLTGRARFGTKATQPNRPTPHGFIPSGHAQIKDTPAKLGLINQASYFLIDGVKYIKVGEPELRGLLTNAIVEILTKRDE